MKEKQNIAGKVVLTVISILFIAFVITYIGFSLYFMDHFFFRTKLNGMDVSCYSADQVKEIWEGNIGDYKLNIVERNDVVESISGSDIDLSIQWDESIPLAIYKQNGFKWLGKLFSPEDLICDTVFDYNEEKADIQIASLACMDKSGQIAPVNAKISDYDENTGFSVIPDVKGTVIDEKIFIPQIKQALLEMREECSVEEMGAYVDAEVREDDEKLVATVEKLNKYAGSVINYEVGKDKWTLDAGIFKDWLKENKDGEFGIDKEKVAEYVKALARQYTTCYSSKEFKTSYGETVTIENSRYGWKVDEEAEQKAIIKEIKAGKSVVRDLHYSMTANSHGKNDFGNSYVEINLTTQHLFLYKKGKLILETDFVSGNVSRGNATPTGIFGVTYTERNATLRGANYATPVSFWMPFNGNVGMHDATWRASFGGNIYKTSGSHGCVNLPYGAAEKIFSVVTKDYPVIVYATSEDNMPAITVADPKPQIAARQEETKIAVQDEADKKDKDKKKKNTDKEDNKEKDTGKTDNKKADKNNTGKNRTSAKNKTDTNKTDKDKPDKNSTNKNSTNKNSTDKNSTNKNSTDKNSVNKNQAGGNSANRNQTKNKDTEKNKDSSDNKKEGKTPTNSKNKEKESAIPVETEEPIEAIEEETEELETE